MDRDAILAAEKAALRVMMIARRRSFSATSQAAMSMAIAGHVIALPEVVNARHIHLYLSIPALAEVSTSAIIDALDAMDKQLSVPVIRNGELLSASFRKGNALRPAPFGQHEPVEILVADESNLDVVLIPLLAFDERGHRIGYGKGFYDRFLRRLSRKGVNPCRIGLSFLQQQVEAVPADFCDELLDGVVHENGIIRFNSNF
jgi:5-formyltetrahydrofolate cyclo-ligase